MPFDFERYLIYIIIIIELVDGHAGFRDVHREYLELKRRPEYGKQNQIRFRVFGSSIISSSTALLDSELDSDFGVQNGGASASWGYSQSQL